MATIFVSGCSSIQPANVISTTGRRTSFVPDRGPQRACAIICGQWDSSSSLRSYMMRLAWYSRPETPNSAPSTLSRLKARAEPVRGQYDTDITSSSLEKFTISCRHIILWGITTQSSPTRAAMIRSVYRTYEFSGMMGRIGTRGGSESAGIPSRPRRLSAR